jgi:hypothetical protein
MAGCARPAVAGSDKECLSAAVLITFKKMLSVSWFQSRTIELFSAVATKRVMNSVGLKRQEDLIVS